MKNIFIAGCGYVGWQLLKALPDDASITVLSHSSDNIAALQQRGIQTVCADLDRPDTLTPGLLPPLVGSTVFYFIPPPSSGSTDPRLQHFLAAMDPAAPPRRLILISATGVYGDCDGAWVDETRPPAPNSDRGRRRLHAEQQLSAWGRQHQTDTLILRVAGIYGPGRLPTARLKKRLPVLREQESPWSNRIHIADLIQACMAAARRGINGGIYNIADGHPSTMTDYFLKVAELLQLPAPERISLQQAGEQMSAGMLSYLAESRRLDNRLLRKELGVTLRYPTLETGLTASRPL